MWAFIRACIHNIHETFVEQSFVNNFHGLIYKKSWKHPIPLFIINLQLNCAKLRLKFISGNPKITGKFSRRRQHRKHVKLFPYLWNRNRKPVFCSLHSIAVNTNFLIPFPSPLPSLEAFFYIFYTWRTGCSGSLFCHQSMANQ